MECYSVQQIWPQRFDSGIDKGISFNDIDYPTEANGRISGNCDFCIKNKCSHNQNNTTVCLKLSKILFPSTFIVNSSHDETQSAIVGGVAVETINIRHCVWTGP